MNNNASPVQKRQCHCTHTKVSKSSIYTAQLRATRTTASLPFCSTFYSRPSSLHD